MEAVERPIAGRTVVERAASKWWLFLIIGVAWILVSVIVLRFNVTSIAAVGTLIGVVLLFAGANEFLIRGVRNIDWRWLHTIMGAVFVLGGIWALVHPVDAFWELASILGFVFVLKGTLDMVDSVIQRDVNELWWLGVGVGILEILLGFWASQQLFGPGAALLLVWVGFGAMLRGLSEIVMAFELRGARKHLAS